LGKDGYAHLVMKLLIISQKVDKADRGALGFFHAWIEEFAKHVQFVTVICLEKGEVNLPNNVKVLSLGKENGRSRIKYLKNFYAYIWREKNNYDAVFVHMNQEYVLLAGWWWRMIGKKVLMWRNHKNGTWLTNLAVLFSNTVFCTSPASYTAKFKKTKIMPAGIDLANFQNIKVEPRLPNSLLSLGRISIIKNIDILIKALGLLDERQVSFTADIVGDPDPNQKEYYQKILQDGSNLVAKNKIIFKESISEEETPLTYATHQIFVNLTTSGSLDKTILEAMLSGTLVLVCNNYFHKVLPEEFIFKEGDAVDLANKIEKIFAMSEVDRLRISETMKKYVEENHSLKATIKEIIENV
jgi:glycosyltransferase involved in cell wall biosynthesis